MSDTTMRKPLDAQFVGKVNQQAMKALGNVNARRKWPDSKAGSPLTTNMLCAEIARLNIERDEMLAALEAIAALSKEEIEARFGNHPNKTPEQVAGKSAIYSLLIVPGNIARAAIAKATGASS